MATRRWLDINNNWADTSNWSGGSEPVSSDDVIIDSGTKDISAGLDNNAVDLTSMKIGPGWTGNLGATGNNLKLGCGEMWIAGGAEVWIEGKTGVALDKVHIDKGSMRDSGIVLAGYMGEINVKRGNVIISANSASDGTLDVRCLYKENLAADALITIGAGITAGTLNVKVTGGHVECASATDEVILAGGSMRVTGTAAVQLLVYLIGGVFYWETEDNITVLWAMGGKLDATKNYANPDSANPPTIGTLHMFPNSIIDLRNGISNLVITAANATFLGAVRPLRDI